MKNILKFWQKLFELFDANRWTDDGEFNTSPSSLRETGTKHGAKLRKYFGFAFGKPPQKFGFPKICQAFLIEIENLSYQEFYFYRLSSRKSLSKIGFPTLILGVPESRKASNFAPCQIYQSRQSCPELFTSKRYCPSLFPMAVWSAEVLLYQNVLAGEGPWQTLKSPPPEGPNPGWMYSQF